MSIRSARRPFALPALLALVLGAGAVSATPPCYQTFKRPQRLHHAPAPEDLLRIWVVFVDQGDGILIQLPERFAYDPDPADADPARSERVEVLVDSGSFFQSDSVRMARFLERLYPEGSHRIEHVVVTHHDADHVRGISACLAIGRFGFGTVHHNGLASYLPEVLGLDPTADAPDDLVADPRTGGVRRAMAFFDPDSELEELREDDLVGDRDALSARLASGQLQGVYHDLARALFEDGTGFPLSELRRAGAGGAFIEVDEGTAAAGGPELSFELLWPPERPRRFRQWSETINGNSVTFRLRYGQFEMLFTGDHNDLSEAALLGHLADRPDALACDVLKVPHHGSRHNLEEFFDRASPVLGVASMGRRGFSRSWRHPSADVVRWLGGPHRAYHTYAHERRFDLTDESDDRIAELVERTHVLIETDGSWFRVVEIPDGADPAQPATVQQTRRGDGTRWIDARPAAETTCEDEP